jgi:hypothetical protein
VVIDGCLSVIQIHAQIAETDRIFLPYIFLPVPGLWQKNAGQKDQDDAFIPTNPRDAQRNGMLAIKPSSPSCQSGC